MNAEKKMIAGRTVKANWNPNVSAYSGLTILPKSIIAPSLDKAKNAVTPSPIADNNAMPNGTFNTNNPIPICMISPIKTIRQGMYFLFSDINQQSARITIMPRIPMKLFMS